MLNLHLFSKIGLFLYIFIYLIFPNLAISQNTKVDIRKNLENSLNSKDLKLIKANFNDKESLLITGQFSEFIKDFPDAKWQIKRTKNENPETNIFSIRIIGENILNGETYSLESNFDYYFSTMNGKINKSSIKNLLTTIRTDQNEIDIIFGIPSKVLTGKIYELNIILNDPLGEIIVAGGIKPHQDRSYLKQEVSIKPLVSGGIFKVTRAPSKPGTQLWSGLIAHPKGIVSFTKSVDIVEKL